MGRRRRTFPDPSPSPSARLPLAVPQLEDAVFELKVRISGVSFKNSRKVSRQDLLGTLYDDFWTEGLEDEIEVELRPEPDNPHDPDAVAVWVTAPEEAAGQVGYVPADQAAFVGEVLEDGRLTSVEVCELGTGSGARVWGKLRLKVRGGDDSPDAGTPQVEDAEGRVYDLYE